MKNKYDTRLDSMSNKVSAAIRTAGQNNKEEFVKRLKNGIADVVIYSAYEVADDSTSPEDDGLAIDNLDDIAFEGTFVVTGDYDEFWDGSGSWVGNTSSQQAKGKVGRSYKSDPITDPTWLQLAVMANECIIATNDFHHIFFEGADRDKNILRLFFGS